jgi:flagellar protein FliS
VETATPAELIGMLYDVGTGAIRAGIAAAEQADRFEAGRQLLRAQDAVMELRCALNPDAGELAQNLDAIYAYLFQRLVDANVRRDGQAAAEALELLSGLQEAWRDACIRQPAATAPA